MSNFNLSNDKTINNAYIRFYEKNGYYPKYFNAYNCSEIIDIAPTITAACGVQNSSGAILILEEGDI